MEEELMNELSPKFILIKLLDDIIIQDINNHDSIESVKTFMNENFGENNYYVISKHGDWGHTILTIVNRKKIVNIKDDLCLVYLYDKEPEIYQKLSGIFDNDKLFKSPLIHLDDYLRRSNQIIKTLSLEKYKFQISWLKFDAIQSYVDPTPNKKYFDWLCKVTVNYGLLSEDYEKYNSLLTDFDNPQVKSLIKKSGYSLDINFYKNSNDLFKVVKECYYDKLEDVEAGDRKILYEKRKIFEDNNWLVLIPESHTEAITLGRGTNWCTSADSEDGEVNYNYYTKNNKRDLLIFINKNDNKKYQYSTHKNDFLDENDDEFDKEIFDNNFIINFYEVYTDIPKYFRHILIVIDKRKYFTLTIEDMDRVDKARLIDSGKYIEFLYKDKDSRVRELIAKAGYYLDELVDDEDCDVRYEVAVRGHRFDLLINDEYEPIRKLIAESGYGLDILIHDKSEEVRCAVVEQNYGLDKLIYDPKINVRRAIAEKGYGLEILINDKSSDVRDAVAEKGYGLDILINDEEKWVRKAVAEQGYGLDILVHDESKHVRRAVIKRGYGLDILVHDEDDDIRVEVAKNGYGLDILINDECSEVREAVAREGYGLDILINDIDPYVREAVARLGYGLEKLAEDSNTSVAMVALRMIKRNTHNGGN